MNNAGYADFGEFKDTDLGKELSMMQLNMMTLVALTKLFLPDLISTKERFSIPLPPQRSSPVPIWQCIMPRKRLC